MELRGYIDVVRRRWRVAVIVAAVAALLVAVGGLFIAPRYQAKAMLRIVTPLGGNAGETLYQTAFATRLMNTYAQIANSDRLRNELKTKLGVSDLPVITVKTVTDSEIIQVIVESNDRAFAIKTANALADILLAYDQVPGDEVTSNSTDVLLPRKATLEQQLATYQQQHQQLLAAYSQASAQLAVLDDAVRVKEAAYGSLEARYSEAVVSDAEAPTTASKAAKAALIKEMEGLQSELDGLNAKYLELSQSANEDLQQVTLIRQNILSTQSAYSSLLAAYESAQMANSRQQNAQKIVLVSPGNAATQVAGLGAFIVLLLALACGIFAGVVAAFVADNLDTRIFIAEQVARLHEAPVLGTLAKVAGSQIETKTGTLDPAIQVDSWMLATRLQNLIEHESLKSIVLTGPNPGTGTSSVAYLLASGLARNDMHVLVIDAGAGKPSISDLFKVTNKPGIADFLKGDQKNLDALIIRNVKPCIDLLPGSPEKGPLTEWLGQARVSALFSAFKDYDVVLLDTPAFLVAPAALSLAGEADRALLVARSERTTAEDLQATCDALKNVSVPVLGIVLNEVPAKTSLASLLKLRPGKGASLRTPAAAP